MDTCQNPGPIMSPGHLQLILACSISRPATILRPYYLYKEPTVGHIRYIHVQSLQHPKALPDIMREVEYLHPRHARSSSYKKIGHSTYLPGVSRAGRLCPYKPDRFLVL